MVKNPEILEDLERRYQYSPKREDWYVKADALFETAMSLNPDAVKNGGEVHLKMLIDVREKFKIIQKNRAGA